MTDKTHFIDNQWLAGKGGSFASVNPATGDKTWQGVCATPDQSAYLSAGQRCTCARRLFVTGDQNSDAFIEKLAKAIRKIKVGKYNDKDPPFMGPVISEAAADQLMNTRKKLENMGGVSLVAMDRLRPGTGFLSPGLMDVSAAPFGGIGISGNHRPSAYYAADYCSFPVASLESKTLSLPDTLSPGIVL
ncbi:MAG: aldehyde dehydrogenase family protein [bacterium]|nr:aldehyde dehydrogenase family protein [bacterium]